MTNLAVALIGVLSVVNLGLTFAAIRQLRRFGERFASGGPSGGPRRGMPKWHMPAGSPIPDFTTTDVAGQRVSLGDLTGARSLVAFLFVGCVPCRALLPDIAQYARSFPGGAAQVVVVVVRSPVERDETAEDYVRDLGDSVTAVVESMEGPTVKAFSVSGYPTMYLLDERGQVAASGWAVRQIAAAVPA